MCVCVPCVRACMRECVRACVFRCACVRACIRETQKGGGGGYFWRVNINVCM